MVKLYGWVQDSDVQTEAKRVLSGFTADNDVIIIKNLIKVNWMGSFLV